jgi:phosphohistidine phosphatase
VPQKCLRVGILLWPPGGNDCGNGLKFRLAFDYSFRMRLLTLIRHSKSSWDDSDLSDFDRPLNARGLRVAPEMAERMAAMLERPLQLISSPAVRALATAQAFAKALGIPSKDIIQEPRIYDASTGALLDVVHHLDDAITHAVLVGHNPGFSELLRLLTRTRQKEMPTCAVAIIGLDAEHWADVTPMKGRLLRFRYPKELGI